MRALLLILTGCNIGLQPVPGLTDSGFPEIPADDTGTDGFDSSSGEDCVDNDLDGYDTCSGDCDDGDSDTHPGAAEAESSTACMTDADRDGYGSDSPAGGVTPGTDCNDANANLSPGEPETPFDGQDSNCDGQDGGVTMTVDGQGNVTIPDNGSASATASVSGCTEVLDLLITINIQHTYQGDLTVTLVPPSSAPVILHNGTGGTTDNIVGTYAPGGGSLSSAQSLVPILGTSGNGTWRLNISDDALIDTGRLVSWSLTLDCP